MDPNFVISDKRTYTRDGKPNPDYTFSDFLTTMSRPRNLAIIKKEMAFTRPVGKGYTTSPSFHSAIEIAYFYKPPPVVATDEPHQLSKCTTATACFKSILSTEMTPEKLIPDQEDGYDEPEDEETLNFNLDEYLKPVLILVDAVMKALNAHNPTVEGNALSRIRNDYIGPQWGQLALSYTASHESVLQQSNLNKKLAADTQERRKTTRVLNQTSISFKDALQVGMELVKDARAVVARRDTRRAVSGATLNDDIFTLISATMFAIGTRLTEVVILSTYSRFAKDQAALSSVSGNLINKKAPLVQIEPLAKERSKASVAAKIFRNEEARKRREGGGKDAVDAGVFDVDDLVAAYGLVSKKSDRVILFGATYEDINGFVNTLRKLLPLHNKKFGTIKKQANGEYKKTDLGWAIHHLPNKMNEWVDIRLNSLNPSKHFTVRSFRGLYVALSYRIWAKQPTSEIMWINTILNHSSITTSLSYNIYALSEIIKVTDRESVETVLTTQETRIDALRDELGALKASITAATAAGDAKTDAPFFLPPQQQQQPLSGLYVYVKLDGGDGHNYKEIRKQPIRRQGQAEKLERIQAVVSMFEEEGIKISSSNLRKVGFSNTTITQWRAL